MPTATLQQLEDRVYSQLDGNTLEFPESFVRAAINQGLFRLNILTGFASATIPIAGGFTTAAKREYRTPAGILIPLRVDFEGVELDRIALKRLGREYRTWAVDTTTSYGPVARWASIGMGLFILHPIDALGGSSLEVTGVANLTPLAAPGDSIQLADAFQDILVAYAKTRVMAKEPGKPFADMALSLREMWRSVQSLGLWSAVEFPDFWLRQQARPASGRGR